MEQITAYAQGMNCSTEILDWLNTTAKKALKEQLTTSDELEHVIDFLNSDAAPQRLRKMSIKDAKRKATQWSKANQKKGRDLVDTDSDIELVHDFLDGTKIVLLKTKKAYQREGFLMGHCLGGYDPDDKYCVIYSYRDAKNMPHATFELRRESDEITQIKGKGNGAIHPKYVHPILAFLKTVGMDIRPSDMKNLGYYHVAKEHVEFLLNFSGINKQMTMINGEAYAY